MAQTINTDTQYGDDIFAKIKQMIESGCTEIILVNNLATPQEEAETLFQADIIGIYDAE